MMHFNLADHYLTGTSFIHRLDPRVKVLITFMTVICLGLVPEGRWWSFGVLGLFIHIILFIARLDLRYVWGRSLIALPFVLAAVALPFTMPGPEIGSLPLLGWTLSRTGLIRFVSILLRSWLAVQMAIMLTATTRFDHLLWALAKLGMPKILVGTLGFMFRYVFMLGDEALRLLRARSSRSANLSLTTKPSFIWKGQVAGHMVGSLFIRSLDRSERVYSAMLSRGYKGNIRMMKPINLKKLDWWVLAMTTVFLIVVVFITAIG